MRIRERFNPRAPCGARHYGHGLTYLGERFQPTRPLRGATRRPRTERRLTMISTHAPLAGRDSDQSKKPWYHWISTHAPLAGRDFHPLPPKPNMKRFQPTRPLRGATAIALGFAREEEISTHAPLAGRDRQQPQFCRPRGISTHAPLAGRDSPGAGCTRPTSDFNPRAPCGARRDLTADLARAVEHFNPRAPCGARQQARKRSSGR